MVVRPCLWPRCPEYAVDGTSFCRVHLYRRRELGLTGARGTSPAWARARRQALARDHHRCRGCGRLAVCVHHVNGNAEDDRLENLLSLCEDCHRARHNLSKTPAGVTFGQVPGRTASARPAR